MRAGKLQNDYECQWLARDGARRLISWSGTSLGGRKGTPAYVIATGIDITERKQLEKAILEISEREQRRIGQDLHDGLGQHLTGIAFMTKVQEQKLKEKRLPVCGRCSQDRETGQRSDQQDSRAGPRLESGCVRVARPDVGVTAVRR